MSYENNDRRWMEDQFKEISQRLAVVDRFMGQMLESNESRRLQKEALADEIEEVKDALRETNKKVDGLLSKINKWEAKLGSFMFIAGCLWAFFMAMKDHIWALVKG